MQSNSGGNRYSDFADIEIEIERGAASGLGFRDRERNVDVKYRKLYEESINPFSQVLATQVIINKTNMSA